MGQRLFGIRQLTINGKVVDAKGHIEYSPGGRKKTAVVGADGRLHGFKVDTIAAYAQGTLTDAPELDIKALVGLDDATVVADLLIGKTLKLDHAAYVADGKASTEEGEVEFRFECDPDNFEAI